MELTKTDKSILNSYLRGCDLSATIESHLDEGLLLSDFAQYLDYHYGDSFAQLHDDLSHAIAMARGKKYGYAHGFNKPIKLSDVYATLMG